jgi:hypothetical protein
MKLPKMSTGLERTFRPVTPPGTEPMIYKEFLLHFIHYYDSDGAKLSSKLDKTIPGRLYREAKANERSLDGEYSFTFPDGITRRLISIR